MINIEAIVEFLSANFNVIRTNRLASDLGSQIHLEGGPIINVCDNGTLHVQGKGDKHAVETVLAELLMLSEGAIRLSKSRPKAPSIRANAP